MSGTRESPNAMATVTSDQTENSHEVELLSVSWNQDLSSFAAGTSRGFCIYGSNPCEEILKRSFVGGRFKIVEVLFRSSFMALVGSETNSQYPPNKVMIWDDYRSRFVGQLEFSSDVCGVKLRSDLAFVVLEHKIYVYKLMDLKLISQIQTISNPRGLCCLSDNAKNVLACPGLKQGQVRIELFGQNVQKIIGAHDSNIAFLTLTSDGLLLATASTKGTLIRIFNTMDGSCLQEVRRGAIGAEIYSIALSPDVQWLAVSSDKGTVHIFRLRVRVVEDRERLSNSAQNSALPPPNSSTSLDPSVSSVKGAILPPLALMKGFVPKYFSSERSIAQYNLDESTRFIVAFGSQNTVNIVGMDGSFHRCSFDPVHGGQMLQQEYVRFINR